MKAILNKFLFCFIVFLLLFFACFSHDMADYQQYQAFYYRVKTGFFYGYQMEIGYVFLEKMFGLLGFNFIEFRAIYLGIAILIFSQSVYYLYRKNAVFILGLYFVFPFFYDITQMRHFMATAIALYSIRYLKTFTLKNIFKFCLFLLLASTQHLIALFWFVLILAYYSISCKKYISYSVVLLFVETLLVFFIAQKFTLIGNIYNIIGSFFFGIRGSGAIFMGSKLRISYLLLLFALLCIQAICLIKLNRLKPIKDNEYLPKISIISLGFLVLVSLNEHFFRAFRSLLVIFYISCFCCADCYSSRNINRLFFRVLPIALAIFLFIMFLSSKNIGNHWNSVVIPIIKNNYLIEYIF